MTRPRIEPHGVDELGEPELLTKSENGFGISRLDALAVGDPERAVDDLHHVLGSHPKPWVRRFHHSCQARCVLARPSKPGCPIAGSSVVSVAWHGSCASDRCSRGARAVLPSIRGPLSSGFASWPAASRSCVDRSRGPCSACAAMLVERHRLDRPLVELVARRLVDGRAVPRPRGCRRPRSQR